MEKLKYFYMVNYVLGKKEKTYFLGLDIGSSFFGTAISNPGLDESFPLKAKFSKRRAYQMM